ncbi:NAD-dependent epimerase [Salinisphaera sp. USBA-960]|uniref:NAD-dependent epimerase n=1 Tax=Salinisphaera orenii TaxID=856731 RepID=UPI000DBE5BF5|nr:NAD-dependent epimerase [Salifodinibacter halophilus]NNC25504.1 NAD-dependent epimerase [Salifodinibacter halophilus]
MRILVTGAAGFVGFYVAWQLLERGDTVIGVDSLNDYYDPKLKRARLARLEQKPGFVSEVIDLADHEAVTRVFAENGCDRVAHMAAQAGVRYSIENPQAYVDSNVTGTLNILEGCRHHGVEHLVYASTSSVYGASTDMPFSPHGDADHPLAIYAATKRTGELMAHAYAHLFGVPSTGLRFFTVYGPWGRPDMAPIHFASKMVAGESIPVFNEGRHRRDFTYIDDIAEGVVRAIDQTATPNPNWSSDAPDPGSSNVPWRIYNIGNGESVALMHFIECLESSLGITAAKDYQPMQPGDVEATHADVSDLFEAVGYRPQVGVAEGVQRFVDWYRDYYRV